MCDNQLKTLFDLKRGECRWPIGDRAPYLFCGDPQKEGRSYCEAHWSASIESVQKPPLLECHADMLARTVYRGHRTHDGPRAPLDMVFRLSRQQGRGRTRNRRK
jgi:hypothetical protein